ncbi:MAG: hypothetical protein Q8N23_22100 [Archangium sp.]|nr:hypothetical protein [Archangium sp.]MDP3155385.1 hypothetical protein [Archangium sp.]MDP3573717.1 hypothetical protein [Archangium sp.]
MSLLPDSATFHERVQDCFVAYRGHGVSLSAVDLQLLDAWAELEVPFEVIARGLRKAAEAALWDAAEGQGRLRSLKAARRDVESEISKFVARTAGRTESPTTKAPEPFHLTRHKKLVATVKKITKPGVPAWVERLPVPDDFGGGDRQELLVFNLLLRALPFPRRSSLLREARLVVEKVSAMSAATRRESLRFHRAALVRQAWSMPALW